MATRMRLTDAGIANLMPRAREYTVWDTRVGGFGVRVRPSGHRVYVYHRNVGAGVRKITLGPVAIKSVDVVRRECLAIEVEAPSAKEGGAGGRRGKVPLFADFVAVAWKTTCYDRHKPSTRKRADSSLRTQLLPAFGVLPLDRITRVGVNRWFDGYSQRSPGGANRALDTLRQIFNHAIALEHLATSPARGVKRNPRPKLTRFLSTEEIRRLHRVLDGYACGPASHGQQADVIRLLLLTGCRKGEIVKLRWHEVDGDVVHLSDSKTGRRRVYLNAQARDIIKRQPREGSVFVFPSPRGPARPLNGNLRLWYSVRKEAGIDDVRLHDLRHTFASHAVMRGIPVPVVARLLGHKRLEMTLRYAHCGDREVEAAAERIGEAVTALMDGKPVRSTTARARTQR